MSLPRRTFSEDELLRDHAYAAPHVEAGRRLHGGFDAAGAYVSPRTAVRWDAVRAWQAALAERGTPLLEADPALTTAGPYPTDAQMRRLLARGLGRPLWNLLTVTGVIEARGAVLCDLELPDFQPIVAEDLSDTAAGHLRKGLLRAHGLDEGGDAARGLGGHDAMWFAVRDLVFGRERHPEPAIPARLTRPDEARRLAPEIPLAHERTLLFLMNVLLVEVRAEATFRFTDSLLADPALFRVPPEDVVRARRLVERIRADERIHVAYLRTVLSELRAATFLHGDGERTPAAPRIDAMWAALVHWHAIENPRLARAQQREGLRAWLLGEPGGAEALREIEALEPPEPRAAVA